MNEESEITICKNSSITCFPYLEILQFIEHKFEKFEYCFT